MCAVRLPDWENLFPHFWQQKGFSPVCVRMCVVRKIFFHTPGNKKVFLQCVFARAWSSGLTGKIFFHTPGKNKVFLQCVRMCLVRWWARENIFPQSWQQCDFLSKWIFACLVKYKFCVKNFPHWWQQNRFVPRTVFVCLIGVIFPTKHCLICWQCLIAVNVSRVVLSKDVAWRADFLLRFKHNKFSSAKLLPSSIWLDLLSLWIPLHLGTSNSCCLFNVFLPEFIPWKKTRKWLKMHDIQNVKKSQNETWNIRYRHFHTKN